MQNFYNALLSATKTDDTHLNKLARLTKARLAQLTALKSDMAWGDWPGAVINTA